MSELLQSHIKAVVFDFDDTLIGTHLAIWNLHRHIAAAYYGIELEDTVLDAHWGRPLSELATHYYLTEDTDEAISRMMHHQQDFPKARFEHSANAIRRLKMAGKILGIVSATTGPILEKDAELVELPLQEFDYVQTAEQSEHHKPDSRVFGPMLSWMMQHGVLAEDIVYIGDGLHDMQAASTAGLHFIGVTTGLVTADEFTKHGAMSIRDLSEL